MAGTRRTTKSRIELEVSQNEAKNRRQFKRIQQWARQTKDQMDGIARVAGRVARVTGTAILAIGGAALRAYGQMEKLQTSFVSMLKSGPKAVKLSCPTDKVRRQDAVPVTRYRGGHQATPGLRCSPPTK